MKKLIAALLVSAAMPAMAADLSPRAPLYTKAPILMPFTWTGFYIGANVGGKWANTSGSVTEAPVPGGPGPTTLSLALTSASTAIGGGQIGYNWQLGQFVYGLEGDAQAQSWSTSQGVSTPFPTGTNLFTPGDVFSASSKWQASIRGRLGIAMDRVLFYATGGVAFTNVKASSSFIAFGGAPATSGTDSATLVGGTVGGGFEYAVTNQVSLGVEGRYSMYGNHTFNTGTVAITPTIIEPVGQSIKLNTAEVLGRINFRIP